MGSAGQTLVNKRSPATSKSGGTATALLDVCKTPIPGAPPAPIPYVNAAATSDLEGAVASVRIDQAPVMTKKTKLRRSCGDEPGSLGGVVSNCSLGVATAITASVNVKIAGDPVVRNLDAMQQNGGNTMGTLLQGQVVAALSAFAADPGPDSATEECAVCGRDHQTPTSSRPGNHLREGSKSIAKRLKQNYQFNGDWRKRFHHDRGGALQGHHLIVCEALKKSDCGSQTGRGAPTGPWAVYCRAFGYDINHYKNGVLLPSKAEVACSHCVPQHFLSHAKGTSDYVDRFDNQKAVYLMYPDAVNKRLSAVRKLAAKSAFCTKEMDFVDIMNEQSLYILQKIASFQWTIREDGYKLKPEGVGCEQKNSREYGRCRQAAKDAGEAQPHLPVAPENASALQIGL